MKNESLIISASIAFIVISILSIFLGAIQPLARAQNFIDATRAPATTVMELENNFRGALDYPSYVGDEESAKFLGGNIRGYIGNKQIPEPVSRELLNFIEPYLEKDNIRHLMMAGQMYLNMWTTYKGQSDYDKAVKYYVEARQFGPKVYPVLFGLLAIYDANGKTAEAKEVGNSILAIWPTDKATIDVLAKYKGLDK
jgi:tetratricopeptide (TPR) repeat protein